MAKFAFRDSVDADTGGPAYLDVYSGTGGKDSKHLGRVKNADLDKHPKWSKMAADRHDVAASINAIGRADYGTHVIVPAGSRKPGKFSVKRHTPYGE